MKNFHSISVSEASKSALKAIAQAVELDPDESEWWFLKGKVRIPLEISLGRSLEKRTAPLENSKLMKLDRNPAAGIVDPSNDKPIKGKSLFQKSIKLKSTFHKRPTAMYKNSS